MLFWVGLVWMLCPFYCYIRMTPGGHLRGNEMLGSCTQLLLHTPHPFYLLGVLGHWHFGLYQGSSLPSHWILVGEWNVLQQMSRECVCKVARDSLSPHWRSQLLSGCCLCLWFWNLLASFTSSSLDGSILGSPCPVGFGPWGSSGLRVGGATGLGVICAVSPEELRGWRLVPLPTAGKLLTY